jgi:hypothetical protein
VRAHQDDRCLLAVNGDRVQPLYAVQSEKVSACVRACVRPGEGKAVYQCSILFCE